jgi:WD40 repeat protein
MSAALMSGDWLVYDTQTGTLLHQEPKAHTFPKDPIFDSLPIRPAITGLSWSKDGKRFVSVGTDNLMKIWDGETYKLLNSWESVDPAQTNVIQWVMPS